VRYFFDSLGFTFEAAVVEYLYKSAVKAWGKRAVTYSTAREDKEEGVDFYVLKIPVDVTLNYAGKRRTKNLPCILEHEGITVRFGVRFGNACHTFKTPVLVIGVEHVFNITRFNFMDVLDSLSCKIKEMLEIGMDAYLDFTDGGVQA
jgi:hypothetical protein